ncbi:nucleolar protein 6 [Anopheles ziemanni]|uniref:nucleolar protein 6 n=1 Tax=Anopheles coustani TaxID=139045 RepID=UPI002657E59C|nr:nucleolar protein 6 [Anopheles coustani]XP_058169158.1 nucleolar protein 6 [Anopheles ziemanni]
MNRVKKKPVGNGVVLKRKKPAPVQSDNESYDSMVDNGTDEDENDDHGDEEAFRDDNESPDSGLEPGAFIRAPNPSYENKSSRMSKVAKRKAMARTDEEAHLKRLKAIKEQYKPPTVEEINRLKETENYYHSNLFRMQTEEMLKEVRVPAKVERFVLDWVEHFKGLLQTMENNDTPRELFSTYYDGIDFPLELGTKEYLMEVFPKDIFTFVPQRTVRIIGGGAGGPLRTSFGKPLIVDLLVTIPDKGFHKEDFLNLRYHMKRAHFLCNIAEYLVKPAQNKLISKVHFEPLKGDAMKPVLVMVPSDEKFGRKVQFHLHAVPEGGKFNKKRFLPERNNVRPAMIGSGHLTTAEEYERFPTPHYNSSILYDLRLAKNAELLEGIIQSDSIREAIILLKIWARQRGFDQGRYGFDGGLITFYIAHLLQNKRIYKNMSNYQIIRLFWHQLAGSSWDKEGISFDPANRDVLPQFFHHYEVVFLDPLGVLNVTANLPVDLYCRVRHESALAIRLLDDRKNNSFVPLFLASYPAFSQYDHIVVLKKLGLIAATIDYFATETDRLDYIGDRRTMFARMVERLLRKGLGKRITYLVPLAGEKDTCTLGISLNASEAFNLVDKGPEAIDKEASEEFRKFWNGKSQLRRFKDGSITESCTWGAANDPIGQKRLIVRTIVLFLLNSHFDIPEKQVCYLAAQFETVLQPWPPATEEEGVHETVEERSLAVIAAFDKLGRRMRDLRKIPLTINAILGTDSVFRYTDPDPPRPTSQAALVNGQLVFLCGKPVHATIQLEASGKWPEELVAIRRLKTAFYLQIAKSLSSSRTANELPAAQAFEDYLDVLHEKYVFRFVIIHQREITIMREYLSENLVTRLQRDTVDSIALEMQASILPKLTAILHGLHLSNSSFGSVAAIAKRWLYSQLIDRYLWPDECTELLLASLYLNQPLQPPIQPQAGFLRWLKYVASTDWSKEMVVVNLLGELDGETLDVLEKQFVERRATFPPLTIVTPCDAGKYGLFGRRAPSMEILNRVTLLAKSAIEMIESNLSTIRKAAKTFFEPSYEGYNVIIHLETEIIVPSGVRDPKSIADVKNMSSCTPSENKEPPVGFDPVALYLKELRDAYGKFALFFYDPCGGDRIAVLWRPDALDTQPFKTSNVNGRMLNADGTLDLNVDVLLQDFKLLGLGLVTHVEKC